MVDTAAPLPTLDAPVERRRFTGDEFMAMIRAEILEDGGPEELLDGEIWVMASEGASHVDLKAWLNRRLIKWAPDEVSVACDSTIKFAPNHYPEPDFAIFPATLKASQVKGPDVFLVIEIADTSRRKDLDIKGPKYREYGVREYWVIDLGARVTHVHRLNGAWPEEPPVPFDAPLLPALLPGLELRLSEAGV
jgi:Uma2 family endonuclease